MSASTIRVAGVVAFYMSAALVMVFVNKAVLNSSPEVPLFFLLLQLLIAVILLHTTAFVSSRIRHDIPSRSEFNIQTIKKLFPVVSVNIIGLVFNTLCLRDVDASFFQIARGMVLPLTITVSSIHTHSKPSSRVLLAAALVTVGFLVGVAPASTQDISNVSALPASPLALAYGFLSALFIAFHSVLIKSALPHCHNNSTITLAYWTNAGSAVMLFPFFLFSGEPAKVVALFYGPGHTLNAHVFVWGSLVTGLFGFLLCVAGLLSIKVTSPITHMFSGAMRSVIQTLLGVWLFGDILTVNRATSILVILVGTMYYTWTKHVESSQRAEATPTNAAMAEKDNGNGEERIALMDRQERDLESGLVRSGSHARQPSEHDAAAEVVFEIVDKEEETPSHESCSHHV